MRYTSSCSARGHQQSPASDACLTCPTLEKVAENLRELGAIPDRNTQRCCYCPATMTGTFVASTVDGFDDENSLAFVLCEGCSCCDGQILGRRDDGKWVCKRCIADRVES